jgi:hypothetical protein
VATAEEGPIDDVSIENSTLLYRWVAPAHIRRTSAGIECRDGAFKNFPNPETLRMSIVLDDTLREHEREPDSILVLRSGYGLVALTAGEVRNLEQQRVLRSPRPEEPAHGDVWGEKSVGRRRRLAQLARWIIEPSGGA